MLRRYILFLKKYPLATAAVAIIYSMVCLMVLKTDNHLEAMILRSLLCGAMAFFLYQISGDKTLASSYNSTWYVIKAGIGFWILALPLGLLGIAEGSSRDFVENIPLQFLTELFLYIFAGLFEELAFRAVINDAIIYRFRNEKYVFVLSAVVSSLVFGAVHIVGSDISDAAGITQAVGKTLQTGITGLALLFLYWKTRNIWACGIIHGIYDFILSLSDCFFVPAEKMMDGYVATGRLATALIITYAVITLIELFIFFLIYRKIGKSIDYQKIREEW